MNIYDTTSIREQVLVPIAAHFTYFDQEPKVSMQMSNLSPAVMWLLPQSPVQPQKNNSS
jgi:hypothetical protein